MPMRIYALAKDLKIDSKELVDLCTKAGITGKGSALASLEDDEIVKLKAFLAGTAKKPPAKPGADGASLTPVRPSQEPAAFSKTDYVPPAGGGGSKIRILDDRPKRSAESVPATSATAPATPADEIEPVPAQETPNPASAAVPVAPAASASAALVPRAPTTPPPGTPIRPLAPIRGPGLGGVLPVRSSPTGQGELPRAPSPPKKREPVIKLAAAPDVKQPTRSAAKSSEPPAQKPQIRLPSDAIRRVKQGGKPPLDLLTERADRSAGRSHQRPPAGGMPMPPAPGADAPLAKPTRNRKQKDTPEVRGTGEADMASMGTGRADRQKLRKQRQTARGGRVEDEDDLRGLRQRRLTRRGVGVSTAAPRKERAALSLPCTVRTFCEITGVGAGEVLKRMMAMGTPININATLSQEAAELLVAEMGLDVDFKKETTLEESILADVHDQAEDPDSLETRPPVVTFLGHVDHGKTSLLDKLIGLNVAAKEAGGITQHIRAYQISKNGRKISFVDTPGHEAFTEMRARGANVTDIAVLVVAADDGVMPQTEEAISHAKAANVPIIVALNKMDLPGANQDRILQQLSAQGLTPSEWSGDVEVVRCSALTGNGLDELLETILVTAELHDYKANPNRAAIGTCLEAEQDAGRGVIAKVMVKTGTLNVGDIIVCGPAHGRVKAMFDTLKPTTRLKKAGPSMPVNITGLDQAPNAGDTFHVLKDIAAARELATGRATSGREQSLAVGTTKVSFDQFQKLLSEGRVGQKQDISTLNLIIRADTRGSIEAITKELGKFDHPEVQVRVLQASVGGITVADVTLAFASNAVIVGFNVIPDEAAQNLADERRIEIRRYDIIYKLTDDIKAMLSGKLKPEERVVELGQALVKQVFVISRVGTVAGCYVSRGSIERGCRIRVFRDGRSIGEYAMESLRRERDDVKEVGRGMECGIRLANFNDVKQNDILEAYRIEEVARTL